jgi:SepF-like predicted cell division protein (DUF552 family)
MCSRSSRQTFQAFSQWSGLTVGHYSEQQKLLDQKPTLVSNEIQRKKKNHIFANLYGLQRIPLLTTLRKPVRKTTERRRKKPDTSDPDEAAPDQTPRIFLKAVPLRSLSDLDMIKGEIRSGKILIIKVSPLARKNIDDIKTAVNELCEFTREVYGDIARLGEERIVITPAGVRIWRERTTDGQQNQLPTAT